MQSVCVCYNLFFSKVSLHLPPIYCLAAPTHRLTVGPLRNEDTTVARDVGRVLSKALGNGCCSAIRFLTKRNDHKMQLPPKSAVKPCLHKSHLNISSLLSRGVSLHLTQKHMRKKKENTGCTMSRLQKREKKGSNYGKPPS